MKHTIPILVLALVFAVVGIWLLSAPNTSAAVSGGILRFPITEPTSTNKLDPALISNANEFAIGTQIFDGLVRLDQNSNVLPAIASSWTVAPDGRTYTFTLRSDVYFHNGRQAKAADFFFSWNRAKGAGGGYAVMFNNIKSFTAPDDFTFVVVLTNTQSSMLTMITLPIFFVIPSEAAGTIGTNPMGTGPFKFVSWTTGVNVYLQANSNYFGGAPYLAGVDYRIYTTVSAQWNDFQASKLELTQVPTSTWGTVKTDPNVFTQSVMNTTGHGIDVVAFPDVRVRQGIQRAINRAAIASDPAVWGYDPGVQLANGVVSPGKGSYDNSDISIPYDPTTALALFAAAGWTDTNGDHILDNGAGTNLRVIVYGASSNARVQRIVNDLSNIGGGGIGAQVSTTTTQNSANLKSIGWNSDYPDPENDLAPFVSGGLYSTRFHYTSAIFDAFFTTGQTTLDPVLRNAAFHAADYQIVITDAVAIPQYYGAMIPVLKKPYVHDLHFGKLGGYPHAFLKDVWMDFYLYLPLISR